MSKFNQKIVLFIEPSGDQKPSEIKYQSRESEVDVIMTMPKFMENSKESLLNLGLNFRLVEPSDEVWSTPSKIGNLFMNRFAIDEDATHEILRIYHLENTIKSRMFSDETVEGMDLIKGIIDYDS